MNAIIDSVGKATESTVAGQQELFRKWVSKWPWVPVSALPFGWLQKIQTTWLEMVGEVFQRENDLLAVELKMGFGIIDQLFRLATAKDPDQVRTQTMELWRKAFDDLELISEVHLRGMENVVTRLADLANKDGRPADRTPRMPGANQTKPMSSSEELKEAMEEYEMARGDWSKGR